MSCLSALPHEAWIGIDILFVLIVGLVRLMSAAGRATEKLEFAKGYRNRFLDFASSEGADRDAYTWLTMKSSRMQTDLGGYGIYSSFQPPFENVIYSNYPIILNMLPRIRWMADNDPGLWREDIVSCVYAIEEAMLRYLGPVDEEEKSAWARAKNPLRWFATGISEIVAVPLYLLQSFGLVGVRAASAVRGSFLFRFVIGVIGLVSLFAMVIGLITDWSTVEMLLQRVF